MAKIVAFIPAKGTSERVPSKNCAILDGDYLFKRKLIQALDCPAITEVCLDTEDEHIARLARDLPVSWLKRPQALSSNATDGHALFEWECSQRPDADLWLQLLCTAPFITADTFSRAIDALMANPHADSLVGISRAKQYCWDKATPLYLEREGRVPNSVDMPDTIIEAMSLYIVRRPEGAGLPAKRYGSNPILFELDPLGQIDINTAQDLALAETVAAGQRAAEASRFRSLSGHFSSTILADICKELGVGGALPKDIRPTSGSKLMGRAKTLQLNRVDPHGPEDSWKGIYDALNSYDFVRQGDVIMVANEVPGRAYFGDLNASLAIRAGAIGVVIDGVTRDTQDVRKLGLPVFAHGCHCNDIKFEGTLGAMNAPIEMGNVIISNNDVVFGDEDGVVVIPRAHWNEVEALGWQAIENEAKIRINAARGMPASELLSGFGTF